MLVIQALSIDSSFSLYIPHPHPVFHATRNIFKMSKSATPKVSPTRKHSGSPSFHQLSTLNHHPTAARAQSHEQTDSGIDSPTTLAMQIIFPPFHRAHLDTVLARTMSSRTQVTGPGALNCSARWKIGNIGNIVVHQQLNRQHIGNRPATSATLLSINNLTRNRQHFSHWPTNCIARWKPATSATSL